MGNCLHLEQINQVKPGKDICEECVKSGANWVHLRACQGCGITLCCDSSENQHARAHFNESKHPIIASAEIGEKWLWCYEDEVYKRY